LGILKNAVRYIVLSNSHIFFAVSFLLWLAEHLIKQLVKSRITSTCTKYYKLLTLFLIYKNILKISTYIFRYFCMANPLNKKRHHEKKQHVSQAGEMLIFLHHALVRSLK